VTQHSGLLILALQFKDVAHCLILSIQIHQQVIPVMGKLWP